MNMIIWLNKATNLSGGLGEDSNKLLVSYRFLLSAFPSSSNALAATLSMTGIQLPTFVLSVLGPAIALECHLIDGRYKYLVGQSTGLRLYKSPLRQHLGPCPVRNLFIPMMDNIFNQSFVQRDQHPSKV